VHGGPAFVDRESAQATTNAGRVHDLAVAARNKAGSTFNADDDFAVDMTILVNDRANETGDVEPTPNATRKLPR
jgi:hypothetical protein